MLICVVKATNKLIEAQSNASAGVLIKNAVRAGYKEADIEEKEIVDSALINYIRTPEVIAMEEAKTQAETAKLQAITDNLPSWTEVEAAIDGVTTIAGLKVVVKRLARVVYWLAKNSAT